MAKGYEVLEMLCKGVEYIYQGFAQYDAWKAEQDTAQATAKAVLLERLGLTQEEFNTLIA
jgi:hypothetical protein